MLNRMELRKCRTELQSLIKEHDRAMRTIEWLQSEKKAADARAETDKATIKKLEIRLSASDSLDAHDQIASLRKECRGLKDELHEARERLVTLGQQYEGRGEEVRVLRRALEVKAEDLSGGVRGSDTHARILYALAKSREDSITIAVSYAEAKEDLVRAKRLLDQANKQIGVSRVHRSVFPAPA